MALPGFFCIFHSKISYGKRTHVISRALQTHHTRELCGKRANQISATVKEELTQKLQEFATTNDNLEEIFENREQIEISKHYEKMAKPTAIATQELLDDKIYMRNPELED